MPPGQPMLDAASVATTGDQIYDAVACRPPVTAVDALDATFSSTPSTNGVHRPTLRVNAWRYVLKAIWASPPWPACAPMPPGRRSTTRTTSPSTAMRVHRRGGAHHQRHHQSSQTPRSTTPSTNNMTPTLAVEQDAADHVEGNIHTPPPWPAPRRRDDNLDAAIFTTTVDQIYDDGIVLTTTSP